MERELTPELTDAIAALRELILAGERYRLSTSTFLGLNVNESQAVSYLLSRGPLGLSDLAELMSMTTGSMTALVDRLEHRGYIVRTPHPTDRRRITVQLSEAGTTDLDDVATWMRQAFAEVADDRLAATALSLRQLADGLLSRADTVPAAPPDRTAAPRRRR